MSYHRLVKTTKRLRVNGKVVRGRRVALGLSVAGAAERIGISRQALYAIERESVQYPHHLTLRQIAMRLGLRMKEIAS